MVVNIYAADDWVLVTVDGERVFSGHSVMPLDLCSIIHPIVSKCRAEPDVGVVVTHTEVSMEQMEVLAG